ncbi:hypothetical protein ANN_25493 [Periplaneta americana]|uniref:Uncharacterized protein n=1 Tax=Periplaneta americana TaxID=6978 RepID=A0ABQ8S1M5_PERAM|nr:hypothetical protein ANN_25493 [Periplaneta americana]
MGTCTRVAAGYSRLTSKPCPAEGQKAESSGSPCYTPTTPSIQTPLYLLIPDKNGVVVGYMKTTSGLLVKYLYQGIKEFKNGYQARVNVIHDENGDLLADSYSILNRWKNYFGQLLIVHRRNRNDRDEIQIQTAEPFIPEPTLSEVEIEIENLKKYKSSGIDQIPAELIQEGGSALYSEIYKLVLAIWEKEIVPEQWKKSIIVSIVLCLLSKNLKVRIYKTVILPLYGCETWTLTLREEHRLRVFENKVLTKIFGAKRDEFTGEWRKLHNTELHARVGQTASYSRSSRRRDWLADNASSENRILEIGTLGNEEYRVPACYRTADLSRLRWAGHVARMGESRNAYRVLVGRPEEKDLWGPRRRWEDNVKMDLREVGYDGRDWINLAQDRDQWRAYVKAAMNLRSTRCSDRARRLRWAGHVSPMGESRNAYRVLVGRPEGKRPLGRPRCRWEDNIKMDLREVGCDGRDWINLAQDMDQWRAYVRAAMNLRVP